MEEVQKFQQKLENENIQEYKSLLAKNVESEKSERKRLVEKVKEKVNCEEYYYFPLKKKNNLKDIWLLIARWCGRRKRGKNEAKIKVKEEWINVEGGI